MLTQSQKLYLYAIYKLGQNGNTVRSAEVAKIVGVSKPSTVKMTQRLIEEKYIVKEPYKEIELTEKGIKEANKIYTSSIIIHNFLKNKAGVSEENANSDAVRIVSQISAETLEKLVQFALTDNS